MGGPETETTEEQQGAAPAAPPGAARPDVAGETYAPLVAADVGSVYTKVFWVEEVQGERRLMAVGRAPTLGPDGTPAPGEALGAALAQALQRAGRAADTKPSRRLLMTSTAAVPRLTIVAPTAGELRTLSSVMERLPVRLLDPIRLDGPGRDLEHVLTQLESQAPDAVLIAGGNRGHERDLAHRAVEAITRGFGGQAPLLLLVGDDAFVTRVAPLLKHTRYAVAGADATAVLGLAERYVDERLASSWSAHTHLGPWQTEARATGSLQGICAATELIAERYDVDVLTLDLGAAHALAVACISQGGRRRVATVTREDLGLRLGRQAILREAGAAAVGAWLPVDVDPAVLRHDARLGVAVPAGLPESVDDLLLEHAFAREALRLVLDELTVRLGDGNGGALPPVDLVIGSGGVLAGVPRLTQATLILLDVVQPDALTQLALDRATALPLLGQLGLAEGADALGAALERDGLLNLGLCIAPVGTGKEGEPAIRVEVGYASRPALTVEVAVGAIEVVPLPTGERAALKLWPARDFDIGLGRGAAATPRAEVEGGAVGIIIDARGRPLARQDSPEKRQAKLLQWLQSTGAYPHFSFVQSSPPGVADEPGSAA
jgi:hypothetical protein